MRHILSLTNIITWCKQCVLLIEAICRAVDYVLYRVIIFKLIEKLFR